ncbi:hypothetical protein ACFL1Y_00430 [Patescibacteria group bacterium]
MGIGEIRIEIFLKPEGIEALKFVGLLCGTIFLTLFFANSLVYFMVKYHIFYTIKKDPVLVKKYLKQDVGRFTPFLKFPLYSIGVEIVTKRYYKGKLKKPIIFHWVLMKFIILFKFFALRVKKLKIPFFWRNVKNK